MLTVKTDQNESSCDQSHRCRLNGEGFKLFRVNSEDRSD